MIFPCMNSRLRLKARKELMSKLTCAAVSAACLVDQKKWRDISFGCNFLSMYTFVDVITPGSNRSIVIKPMQIPFAIGPVQ